MNSELTMFIALTCTSGVINFYLCLNVYLKRYNYRHIANYFILYTTAITIYCFAAAFGLLSETMEQIKFWTIIQYLGMPASSPLGLLFIMKYLGMKITKRTWIALLIIPFISLIMVATNDYHHLHYRVYEVEQSLGIPFTHIEIGIWYVIHGVFTFSCMFVAFLLVLSRWKDTEKSYRPQLITLLGGQLVPMLTAFLYLIGLTPPGIDPVPVVIWLSSLFYLWAIKSSRMFSVMPIAKDAIFNSINDGVIVLDESKRLIEYNRASKQMFPGLHQSLFGESFDKVWSHLAGEAFPITLNAGFVTQELEIEKQVFQVRASSLQNANSSQGLLLIFTDITAVKELQLKLEHHAYYDELTQIYNRRAFFQHCEQMFAESKQAAAPFTAILIDVDYFKKVNDTYGHDVGDQLLRHVVKVCRTQLTEEVLFARYGGEEFVVTLKGSLREGEALANILRREVELQPLITAEGIIAITLSSGVAEASAASDETLNELLIKADKALYAAKQDGRNQVHVYI